MIIPRTHYFALAPRRLCANCKLITRRLVCVFKGTQRRQHTHTERSPGTLHAAFNLYASEFAAHTLPNNSLFFTRWKRTCATTGGFWSHAKYTVARQALKRSTEPLARCEM